MAIFKNQIEDLAGTIPATCDAEQFLKDGVADIITKIKKVAPSDLDLFSTEIAVPDGGLELIDSEILTVTRDDATGSSDGPKPCTKIDKNMRHSAVDSDSLDYAGVRSPVFYILDQKLYILPLGGSSRVASIVKPSLCVVTSWSSGTSSITNFPDDKYHLAVQYASYCVVLHNIALANADDDFEKVQALSAQYTLLKQEYESAFAGGN
jgi:hypothetical protein